MGEPMDRRSAVLGLLGAAGTAFLAACSGSDDQPPAGAALPSPSPTPTPTPSPSVDTRPRWPLTGELLKDASAAARPAVAVKVPDNRNEHPQVGIDRADVVFVELDGYRDASGYSGTRLMPVFHSRLTDGVGPVRSIRPVDVPLLAPVGAVIGSTGGTGWVLDYVEHFEKYVDGSLTYLATKGTGSYSIDPARVRTYQGVTYYDRAVVCHPRVLAQRAARAGRFRDADRAPYFPFASAESEVSTRGAAARPARVVRVPWKQRDTYDMGYRYDEKTGRYLRSMPWGAHVLADGTRVAPDNVLVVLARQRYAKLYKGRGKVEPVHDVIRSRGTFYYFHGGAYVKGTWAKGQVNEPFEFTTTDGQPLRMAPGQTFVELARTGARPRVSA